MNKSKEIEKKIEVLEKILEEIKNVFPQHPQIKKQKQESELEKIDESPKQQKKSSLEKSLEKIKENIEKNKDFLQSIAPTVKKLENLENLYNNNIRNNKLKNISKCYNKSKNEDTTFSSYKEIKKEIKKRKKEINFDISNKNLQKDLRKIAKKFAQVYSTTSKKKKNAKSNLLRLVELFLQPGFNHKEYTLLHFLAKFCNFKNNDKQLLPAIKNLFAKEEKSAQLYSSKKFLNALDNDGFSALYYLAKKGNINTMKFLMENGADVNIKLGNGKTLLQLLEGEQEKTKNLKAINFLKNNENLGIKSQKVKDKTDEIDEEINDDKQAKFILFNQSNVIEKINNSSYNFPHLNNGGNCYGWNMLAKFLFSIGVSWEQFIAKHCKLLTAASLSEKERKKIVFFAKFIKTLYKSQHEKPKDDEESKLNQNTLLANEKNLLISKEKLQQLLGKKRCEKIAENLNQFKVNNSKTGDCYRMPLSFEYTNELILLNVKDLTKDKNSNTCANLANLLESESATAHISFLGHVIIICKKDGIYHYFDSNEGYAVVPQDSTNIAINDKLLLQSSSVPNKCKDETKDDAADEIKNFAASLQKKSQLDIIFTLLQKSINGLNEEECDFVTIDVDHNRSSKLKFGSLFDQIKKEKNLTGKKIYPHDLLCEKETQNLIKEIINNKMKVCSVNEKFMTEGDNIFLLTITEKNLNTETKIKFLEHLIEGKAKVNIHNKYGNSPLHLAIDKNNSEIIKFLLKQGKIRLNIKNNDGETSLHLAVLAENSEIIELLLGKNSEKVELLSEKDNDGNTPLHLAIITKNLKTIKSVLKKIELQHLVIKNNYEETPLDLIINDHSMSIHILSQLVKNKNHEAITVFIDKMAGKIEYNKKNFYGKTLLSFANQYHCKKVIKILVKKGAKFDEEIDNERQDSQKKTTSTNLNNENKLNNAINAYNRITYENIDKIEYVKYKKEIIDFLRKIADNAIKGEDETNATIIPKVPEELLIDFIENDLLFPNFENGQKITETKRAEKFCLYILSILKNNNNFKNPENEEKLLLLFLKKLQDLSSGKSSLSKNTYLKENRYNKTSCTNFKNNIVKNYLIKHFYLNLFSGKKEKLEDFISNIDFNNLNNNNSLKKHGNLLQKIFSCYTPDNAGNQKKYQEKIELFFHKEDKDKELSEKSKNSHNPNINKPLLPLTTEEINSYILDSTNKKRNKKMIKFKKILSKQKNKGALLQHFFYLLSQKDCSTINSLLKNQKCLTTLFNLFKHAYAPEALKKFSKIIALNQFISPQEKERIVLQCPLSPKNKKIFTQKLDSTLIKNMLEKALENGKEKITTLLNSSSTQSWEKTSKEAENSLIIIDQLYNKAYIERINQFNKKDEDKTKHLKIEIEELQNKSKFVMENNIFKKCQKFIRKNTFIDEDYTKYKDKLKELKSDKETPEWKIEVCDYFISKLKEVKIHNSNNNKDEMPQNSTNKEEKETTNLSKKKKYLEKISKIIYQHRIYFEHHKEQNIDENKPKNLWGKTQEKLVKIFDNLDKYAKFQTEILNICQQLCELCNADPSFNGKQLLDLIKKITTNNFFAKEHKIKFYKLAEDFLDERHKKFVDDNQENSKITPNEHNESSNNKPKAPSPITSQFFLNHEKTKNIKQAQKTLYKKAKKLNTLNEGKKTEKINYTSSFFKNIAPKPTLNHFNPEIKNKNTGKNNPNNQLTNAEIYEAFVCPSLDNKL